MDLEKLTKTIELTRQELTAVSSVLNSIGVELEQIETQLQTMQDDLK